jgi:hypothetical protein
LICRWLMYIFCCIACLFMDFGLHILLFFNKKIQIVASLFSIASLVWFFSHSWMMMKFLLWYFFDFHWVAQSVFQTKLVNHFLNFES